MDQITALERELLHSVSGLIDGSAKEIAALRASLKDYDANVTSGIEERLNEIERTQKMLHRRLNALETQHGEAWSKLGDILADFSARLKAYEASTSALSNSLNRLSR